MNVTNHYEYIKSINVYIRMQVMKRKIVLLRRHMRETLCKLFHKMGARLEHVKIIKFTQAFVQFELLFQFGRFSFRNESTRLNAKRLPLEYILDSTSPIVVLLTYNRIHNVQFNSLRSGFVAESNTYRKFPIVLSVQTV